MTATLWLAQAQVVFNTVPSRIVGQPFLQQQGALTAVSANLVEGRELNSPQAVAVDTSSTPQILYVADTNNNRVLAWRSATAFTKGDAADKVIGQRDFNSTSQNGPGSLILTTGLTLPTALAVDKSGNLYVTDAGNNRILRYPAPFTQTVDLLPVDLIIGQHDFSGRAANEGLSAPSAKTLFFSNNSAPFRSGLAFDSAGNLWASDPGNNRVLRYPAASLKAGNFEPEADLVLGQLDFSSRALPVNSLQNGKNFLSNPSGIAFDLKDRLFVADAANRAVVYTPPFVSGQSAARLIGVVIPSASQPTVPLISDNTLGNRTQGGPPEGVFVVGSNPFVVDRGNARILKYDPYEQWPDETTLFSPKAIAVIGQTGFTTNLANLGQPQPSESSFSGPAGARNVLESGGVVGAVFAGNDLYVADAGNNRVLVFPMQAGGNFRAANRVLGQVDFRFNAINLVEGREFFFNANGLLAGGSVVVDTASNPPHLYVADAGNNRILGFRDYRKVTPGMTADLVIGQPDLFTTMLNYPKNDNNQPNDQGLFAPQGMAMDRNGDLWVADTGNGRMLRFPKPFDQGVVAGERANLVIGQASFFVKVPDASSQTMRSPFGVAFTADGHLLVSDAALNRVLFFLKPSGGDFVNGQTAKSVIGQPDFGPPSTGTLSSPRHIATDPDDKLYVADSGNGRIAIYRNVITAGNDPAPSFSLAGLSNPTGVVVDQQTSEIWVANTGGNAVLRFPKFDTLVLNTAFNVTVTAFGPLSVAVDSFGNPVIAEASTNRVSFFYPAIDYTGAAGGVLGRFSGNGANYFQRFAPGMLASIFAFQSTHFGLDTAGATTVPLPTTLGDVQVVVGGTAAPLLYISPGQINFQVPSNVIPGALAEFQVIRASTGQILASTNFKIQPYSPGLFTADSTGTGQLLALNQDGTVNGPLHPAKAGTIIQMFGTGIGVVAGGPPDGTPSPNQPVSTDQKPDVYINAVKLDAADVTYSGLAPGFIGLWQINAKIPVKVPTSEIPVPIAVVYQGINSRADELGNGRTTSIRTIP